MKNYLKHSKIVLIKSGTIQKKPGLIIELKKGEKSGFVENLSH